ncbi:MAG: diaminopimelate epimerase [bacterium]
MALRRSSISFTKMESGGNDFIVIDNRKKMLPRDLSKLAVNICQRRSSIGADGLILLERAEKADYRMRIFNPDGSEPEMCGNGARCLAKFAFINGIASPKAIMETKAGNVGAWVKGKKVKVRLSAPSGIKINFEISLKPRGSLKVNFINVGVPHVVVFVPALDKVNVESLGRMIRYHQRFAPSGVNVNFVTLQGRNSIYIRTYERGVETETPACGTGAVASALLSGLHGKVFSPVQVHTRGGQTLKVEYVIKKDVGVMEKFKGVWLEGEVRVVYKGEVEA